MPASAAEPLLVPRREAQVGAHVRLRTWDVPVAAWAPPTSHGAVEVSWIESGEVRYRVGTRPIEARPGDVVVIPWGVEHQTTFVSAIRCGALWIDREVVAETAAAFECGTVLEAGQSTSPEVVTLAHLLADEVKGAAPGHLRAAEALLEAILIRVLRGAVGPTRHSGARDPRLLAAVELVHSCYRDDLGIEELARAAGMSRFHFSRLFRDQIGTSPYRYLLDVRLARAAELLRGGRHGVTEAAFAVGFQDLGRFARAFRARFGCRPSDCI